MSEIRAGAPVGAECGSVFEIEDQVASVLWKRELTGRVAKTTKAQDRDTCNCEAQFYAELADGTYLAVCHHHYEVVR